MFRHGNGGWEQFRGLPDADLVDFHRGRREFGESFPSVMAKVREEALEGLRTAQKNGRSYVLFTHGKSTSGPFKMSARSVIRRLMRSPEATPFVIRKECIQFDSAFVAAIRPTAMTSQSTITS